MVTKRDQVLEPLDPGRRAGFERAPDAAVQVHASLQQQVLIDDVLEQRLRESVLRLEPRTRLLVDELGIEQEFEVAAHLAGSLAIVLRSAHRSVGRSRRPPGQSARARATDRPWRAKCPGC
jgi:hypothetical protein